MKSGIISLLFAAALLNCCGCHKPAETEKPDKHELMVRFEKNGSDEFFNVAVRDEMKPEVWFVFRLRHYNDHGTAKYMDLWRIDWAYKGEWNAETGQMDNVLDKILTDGESESVLKDYGLENENGLFTDTYDFTGGFHGDERIDIEPGCGVVFFMDEKVLTRERLSLSFDWTECGAFRYVQTSTMHKTALKVDGKEQESDHHIIAGHVKSTVFGDGGYKTYNTLTMRDEIDFYWYFGICCVGTAVADYGANEDGVEHKFTHSGATVLQNVGKREYHAWSYNNGIEAYVTSSIDDVEYDKASRMHIWDRDIYAKYYRRYPGTGPHRTSVGETFSASMIVQFKCLW